MTRTRWAVALSAVLGALIWALSPAITGKVEPWDANSMYYYVALFVAGLVSGTALPARKFAHYGGSVLGQALYMLIFLKAGSLIVLGLIVLWVYSLLYLAGASLGIRLRRKGETNA